MKIAWLSPAAGNSGIVEYTRQILPALAAEAETELWSHGPAEPSIEAVPVIDYAAEPQALERLPGFDMVFYNLGNHLGFHRHVYEASLRCPGVVILHDRTLQHFFTGYYFTCLRAPELYLARMTALYGQRGRQAALAVIAERGERSWDSADEDAIEHAFIEDALANAVGAVVHSASHAVSVRRSWAGPVRVLDMPAYDAQLRGPRSAPPARSDGLLTLMSIGHVESSKHIHTVVQTLADTPEIAERTRYLIIGQYDLRSAYVRDLNRLIGDFGLARKVLLLGYVPPATLQRYAAIADIFINLRFPNFESGSASLMEQLAHGRPIVVYDSGVHGQLPDDAVAKVKLRDRGQFAQRLHQLIVDPELRERLGAAARRVAEQHRVPAYARSLVAFAGSANSWRPRLRLADRVGGELNWIGVDANQAVASRIGAEIDALLGARPRDRRE